MHKYIILNQYNSKKDTSKNHSKSSDNNHQDDNNTPPSPSDLQIFNAIKYKFPEIVKLVTQALSNKEY